MAIDVREYLEAKHPVNPLTLLPEGVLQHIVDGFCSHLHAGVAVLYLSKDHVAENLRGGNVADLFDRIQSHEPEKNFHPFCWCFRSSPPHDHECREFDAKKALTYWQDADKKPEKYECHMGLLDMTYPLRLRGRAAAVAFAGQMLTPVAVEEIEANIRQRCAPEVSADLINLFRSPEKCPRHDAHDVDRVFDDFCTFGQMLQDLLDRLYNQRWEAARRAFLNDVVRELTVAPATTQEEWSNALNGVLNCFLEMSSLHSIKVYSRRHSRYDLWGEMPAVRRPDNPVMPIPARCVAELGDAQLTTLSTFRAMLRKDKEADFNILQRAVGCEGQEVRLFLHRHQGQPTLSLDSLIAVAGNVADEDLDFVKDFSETIAMRVRVTRLVFVLQEERKSFEDRVGHVGHTAKTPLQTAVFSLERLRNQSPEMGAESAPRLVDSCERNILLAKAYIREIYTAPALRGRERSLRDIVYEVIQQAEGLADERKCKIRFEVEPLFGPVVRDQGTLPVALMNLLDNATKYSVPGTSVTVRLHALGQETAIVEIENQGQGIPETHLDLVRQSHERWVPDGLSGELQRRRAGAGLGLSMAIEYVENHGGWLDIRSYPDDPRYRDDPKDHWTTLTSTALPCSK